LLNYLAPRYGKELVYAVLDTRSGFEVVDILQTVEELSKLLDNPLMEAVKEAYHRVGKIIAKVKEPYEVEEEKFQQEEERELYKKLLELEQMFKTLPVKEKVEKLTTLKGTIDQFFDRVMVMAKDETLRRNRIALLQRVKRLFERVANFDKLPHKGGESKS